MSRSTIKSFDDFLLFHRESDSFSDLIGGGDKDAQREGNFGVSHRDMIESWRECLMCELRWLADDTKDMIEIEIENCEAWHVTNGSIDDQI